MKKRRKQNERRESHRSRERKQLTNRRIGNGRQGKQFFRTKKDREESYEVTDEYI